MLLFSKIYTFVWKQNKINYKKHFQNRVSFCSIDFPYPNICNPTIKSCNFIATRIHIRISLRWFMLVFFSTSNELKWKRIQKKTHRNKTRKRLVLLAVILLVRGFSFSRWPPPTINKTEICPRNNLRAYPIILFRNVSLFWYVWLSAGWVCIIYCTHRKLGLTFK